MIKKVIGLLVAFIMIATGVIVSCTAVMVTTFVNMLNPMCLAENFIIKPISGVVDSVFSAVGGILSGGDMGKFVKQLDIASVIYQVGDARPDIDEWDIQLALMVGIQESRLQNHGHLGERNDHNSIGVYQQQYGLLNANGVEYYGTPEQLHNPVYATNRFFDELVKKVPDRSGISFLDAAIKTQNPSRSAYLSQDNYFPGWEESAKELLNYFKESNPEPVMDEDKSIAVIGDSITVASNSYLLEDLASAGYDVVRVDAQGARSTFTDTDDYYVPSTPRPGDEDSDIDEEVLVSGITAIREQRESGYDPRDWIILLGTNDIGNLTDNPETAEERSEEIVNSIMDELGAEKRVMWLTVYHQNYPERADVFNRTLTSLTDQYDNMLIGDWAAMVEENPQWLSDQVHYNPDGSKNRSSFISRATGLLGNLAGLGARVVLGSGISGALPGGCNLGSTLPDIADLKNIQGKPAGPDSPIQLVSNPRIAYVAANFEQSFVGAEVVYGAPRQRYINMGLKGNFGHGNKKSWFENLTNGPEYLATDCSGYINLVLFKALDIEYSGCSHSYTNLHIGGQEVTKPVMYNQLDASYLQPGDFVVKHNGGCLGGERMNHIVIVLGVDMSDPTNPLIVTGESRVGDGVVIDARPAEWFNSNWPDLVVSRWIGPGAIVPDEEATSVNIEVGQDE